MAKKRGKQRTQAKFRNAVIQGVKRAFTYYSPKYQEVKNEARRELPKFKKDGTRAAVDEVWFECALCKKLAKEIEIDHRDPIVPINTTASLMELSEIVARTDCDKSNLWALCVPCHDAKSSDENRLRKDYAKARKNS